MNALGKSTNPLFKKKTSIFFIKSKTYAAIVLLLDINYQEQLLKRLKQVKKQDNKQKKFYLLSSFEIERTKHSIIGSILNVQFISIKY